MKALSVVGLLMLFLAKEAKSQNPVVAGEAEAGLIESVARYVYARGFYTSSRDTLTSSIKVDGRSFQGGRVVPSGQLRSPLPEVVAARLSSIQGFSVVSEERAARCGPYAPSDCMDNGRSIVLSFAIPEITADSGFVDVLAQVSVSVSAADSIAFVKSGSRNAFALRRASAGVDRFYVKKVGGLWVVQRVQGLIRT